MSEQFFPAVSEGFVECSGEGAGAAADNSLERLREDAERYRWLRQQQAINCWPQVVDGLCRLTGDALDAAVDEAMHVAHGGCRPRGGRAVLN